MENKIAAIHLGDEIPNYARDHDAIHQRLPKLPPGQDCVLVSWIDNDPHTILFHGCYADADEARKAFEVQCDVMRKRGQPIMGNAGTINLGFWMSWPPKPEYFVHDAPDRGQGIVDRTMHEYIKRRERARDELVARVEARTNTDLPTDTELLDPEA